MRILLFVLLITGLLMASEARTRFRRQLSRDLYECVKRSCLTTNQYDPVCGSDGLTYDTRAKLDCAVQFCQKVVSVTHRGACQ